MNYRANGINNLTNSFHLEDGFDELQKAWPYLGTPILDPTRYPTDEKELIPLTGRIIRSLYFNNFADALAAIQHRIKNEAGNVIFVDQDGAVTDCNVRIPLKTITAIWSSRIENVDIAVSTVSKTVTGNFDSAVTGYAFETELDVPGHFGSNPYSSNNFSVFLTAKLIDKFDAGLWNGQSGNILNNLNNTGFLITSYCPKKSDVTKLLVKGKYVSLGSPTVQAQAYPWNFNSNVSMPSILTNSSNFFKGYSTKSQHPVFQTKIATTQEPLNHMSARTRSLKRIQIQHSLDWGDSKVLADKIYPYTDKNVTRGVCGGVLTRNRSITPDSIVNPTDVSIEFSLNGYFFNTYLRDDLFERGPGYITKSGVFLRLTQYNTTIPKNLEAESYDYNNYPWFEGYLLRFNAQPVAASDNALDGGYYKVDKKVGSWCIMKVTYEQFGGEHEGYKRFWDLCNGAPFDPEDPLTVGVVGKTYTSHERLGSCPPGEYEVLGYSPVSEEIIPFIRRVGYENFVDNGDNWNYKFQIEGGTLSFWKRNLSVTNNWTLVLSVVDPNPYYPKPGGIYYPSGLYSKGSVWADDRVNESGFVGEDGTMSLCNIVENIVGQQIPSKQVEIKALFFNAPGSPSVPTIS